MLRKVALAVGAAVLMAVSVVGVTAADAQARDTNWPCAGC